MFRGCVEQEVMLLLILVSIEEMLEDQLLGKTI